MCGTMIQFTIILALLVAGLALWRAYSDHRFFQRRVCDLQRKVLDAERLLRLRGNLASEIAHEIKNPISAILCSAETLDLLIGKDLAEEHRISLRYIKEYGDNLLQLLSDFLDVSMAESGHVKARADSVQINQAVNSVLGLLESNAFKKRVKLRQLCAEENLIAFIDPKHLKQIIFNLVHNAIRFTPEGGEVQVVTERAFPSPFVTVYVRDNGSGIPNQELPGLFDLYARYEGNQPSTGAGVGLGLALCKSLIELAGGQISVTSEVNVGTSFELKIPAPIGLESQASLAEAQIDSAGQPLLGQKFLVVDQDIGARESVARLIEAWGGMVDRVALAADAIEALTRKSYDAVMIDSDIDEGYGCEVARILKSELELENTTIILSTSSAEKHKEALQSGADRCIEKPFNGKALLGSLVKSGKYYITH